MKKTEAKSLGKFHNWLRVNYPSLMSCPIEGKSSRGTDSIAFSELSQHQLDALYACTTDQGYYFKIPDGAYQQLPFDAFFFRNSPAYYVMFYPKKFYIISIHQILHEIKTSKRRSLTETRAESIAIISSK